MPIRSARTGGRFVRLLIGAAALLVAACADRAQLGSPQADSPPPPAIIAVKGKVRDIGPAVRRALPAVNMTWLTETGTAEEGAITFELVGLRGEPGSTRFIFNPTDGTLADLRAPRAITVACSIGRFGEPARQRDLARRIAKEIRDLARQD